MSLNLNPVIRDEGFPTSSNGASSMRVLGWPGGQSLRFRSASVVITPDVAGANALLAQPMPDLQFMAMQVSFYRSSDNAYLGGAHAGIQINQNYPNNKAVNWGGGNLSGPVYSTNSDFANSGGDLGSWDGAWIPGVANVIVITEGAAPGVWDAFIATVTGPPVFEKIGELNIPGSDIMGDLVLFYESFSECEQDPMSVRYWSLEIDINDGNGGQPYGTAYTGEMIANYQSYDNGGCTNTNIREDGSGGLYMERPQPRENGNIIFSNLY